jgi:hypothetical protein
MKTWWDGMRLLGVLCLVYALVCMFVLSEGSISDVFQRESQAQHALLGAPAATYAETRASNLFTRLIVNSGTMEQSFSTTAATPASPVAPATPSSQAADASPPAASDASPSTSPTSSASPPSSSSSSGAISATTSTIPPAPDPAAAAEKQINAWLNQRMRVIWTVVFFTILRASYALLWWPFAVLAVVPVLVDAIASRKVRANSFALTSPQLQGLAMRILPLLLVAYFLLAFLPFYESPMTVPIGIVLSAPLFWLSVVEFAKRG